MGAQKQKQLESWSQNAALLVGGAGQSQETHALRTGRGRRVGREV